MGVNKVKVSVIIPVYNVEKYLEQCLESLINQTLKNIEIICVDDGSTDKSLQILDHYAKTDNRIIMIQQKNQYAGVARNNGLKVAKGEYVIFLDSDDFFDRNLLKKAYMRGISTDADVVLFGGQAYDVSTGSYIERRDFLRYDILQSYDVFSKKDIPDRIFGISTLSPWTKMFKKQFVDSKGLYFQPLQNSNDVYFVVCALAFAEKIAYVNEKLIYYRVGQEANLQSKKSKAPLCFLDAYEAVYDTLLKEGIYDEVKKSYITAFVSSSVYNLDTARASKDCSLIKIQTQIMDRLTIDLAKKIDILECPDDYYGDRHKIAKLRGYKAGINWYKKSMRTIDKEVNAVIDNRITDKPKVSVIIPVYNTELYLKQCIDSVVNQTLREIEIICVDDGSKDGSLEILKAYAQKDNRFCICTQSNSGQAAARNRGISKARGEYLYFMDSDDALAENALDILHKKAEEQNLDILYFDGDSFTDSSECTDLVAESFNRYSRKQSYDGLYCGRFLMMQMRKRGEYQVSPCLQIIKKDFFLENDLWFEEGIVHEDELFTYKSMLKAERTSHVNMKLFHRRYRPGSVMTSAPSFKNVYGYFKGYLKMSRFVETLALEPDCEATALEIMGSRLKSAKDKYQMLTEDEKWTYLGLAPYEQSLFKSYVISANSVVIDDRAKQLEKELNFLRNSYSFKVGFALVYPFSRLKSLLRK